MSVYLAAVIIVPAVQSTGAPLFRKQTATDRSRIAFESNERLGFPQCRALFHVSHTLQTASSIPGAHTPRKESIRYQLSKWSRTLAR